MEEVGGRGPVQAVLGLSSPAGAAPAAAVAAAAVPAAASAADRPPPRANQRDAGAGGEGPGPRGPLEPSKPSGQPPELESVLEPEAEDAEPVCVLCLSGGGALVRLRERRVDVHGAERAGLSYAVAAAFLVLCHGVTDLGHGVAAAGRVLSRGARQAGGGGAAILIVLAARAVGAGGRAGRVRVLAGDHALDAARAGAGAVVARGAARTRAGAVPASDTCGAGGGPAAVQVDLPGGAVGACGRAGRAGVLATFCADKDTYTLFRLLRNGQGGRLFSVHHSPEHRVHDCEPVFEA